MTPKEQKEAGNALVNWFNSQEINQVDALAILSKVAAKILVAKSPKSANGLQKTVDTFTLTLVNDTNAQSYSKRWGDPK